MIKKVTLSYMLAVTVAQGVLPVVPAFASAPAPRTAPAAATSLAAAPVVLPEQAPAGAVRLSRDEMEKVEGGFFNWLKRIFAAVTIIVRIWGLVKQLIDLFRDKGTETTPSSVEGGETVQRNENEYHDYASQEDYDAGNVQSITNEAASDYQQTEVWYGDQCASTYETSGEQTYQMQEEIRSC